MKKDWTYKKLGEVTKIKTGKLDANASSEDGIYPFFTCSKEPLRISSYSYDCECVLVAGNGDLNVKYYKGKFDAYQRTYVIETTPDSGVMTYYMYHFFNKYIETLRQKSIGGIIKYIKLGDLTEATIPIPPISIQESIVRELDAIHGILEKKQEQLRELDNLAQAIFYEMFGDPITNPMGWEIKKLGECFPYIKNGANIKQDRNAGGIPITRIETLSGGVFNRHKLGYADIFELGKYEHYVLSDGDLLLSHINSKIYIGRTVEYKKYGNEQIIHGMNLLCLKADKEILSSTYFAYFTHCEKFKNDIARIRKDAVNQSSISISDLKNFSLPLPPLSLQQSFAAKIEAIEAQKQAVQQSIREVEALLAQRMDHYFN